MTTIGWCCAIRLEARDAAGEYSIYLLTWIAATSTSVTQFSSSKATLSVRLVARAFKRKTMGGKSPKQLYRGVEGGI